LETITEKITHFSQSESRLLWSEAA
jgi:hypothetical protein